MLPGIMPIHTMLERELDGGYTPQAGNNVNFTTFSRGWSIPNNAQILAISVYASAATTGSLKIARRVAAGQYEIMLSQAFSHAGAGWQRFELTAPYLVGSSDTYYPGVYVSSSGISVNSPTIQVANGRKVGDQSGNTTGWTEDTDTTMKNPILRIHFIP
ncbi:hypothetical protein GCM10007276_12390 [Agaricicola taiwanensis]|uniref:Uncharacterized protein n=1 Tax=Agaricicola taiwanensis TaxID=591372 RepID=A0A8J2YED9_9RHOB|nr:hypothetical protein [Agaricicola taiwanensis]GGE36415.1 hypothetical protein GCM10007276_12390 [Agaricicola taiwanensis]